MNWTKRPPGKHRPSSDRPTQASPPATRSPETERALAAAREAARDLAAASATRARLDRLGDAIDAENSKNGFRLIIESALGGKA